MLIVSATMPDKPALCIGLVKLVSKNKKEKKKEKTNKWKQFIEGFGQKGTLLSRREREIFWSASFFGCLLNNNNKKKTKKTCLTDKAAILQIYIQFYEAHLETVKMSTAGTQKLPVCFIQDSHMSWLKTRLDISHNVHKQTSDTTSPWSSREPLHQHRHWLWSSMSLWLEVSENTSLTLQQQGN